MPTPKLEKDGLYSIRLSYKDALGVTQRKYQAGFKKPAQAIIWADKMRAELEGGLGLEMTFYELCDYFLQTKSQIGRAPKTIYTYNENLEVLKKKIGNPKARKITSMMIQEVVNAYAKELGRCEHLCSTMSALFNFAKKKKIIRDNPFDYVDKPSFVKPKKKQSYTVDQYSALLELIKSKLPKYYAPVILMGSFGLRPGEAIAIEEGDFDQTSHRIAVSKSSVIVEKMMVNGDYITERTAYHGQTKTHTTRRLPYTDKLYAELHYYKKLKGIKSRYICCYENGAQITSNAIYQALKELTEKHNLPNVTPYSLRHTFGNINKRLGTDSYTTSKLMGHATERTTKENYYENDEVLNSGAMDRVMSAVFGDEK